MDHIEITKIFLKKNSLQHPLQGLKLPNSWKTDDLQQPVKVIMNVFNMEIYSSKAYSTALRHHIFACVWLKCVASVAMTRLCYLLNYHWLQVQESLDNCITSSCMLHWAPGIAPICLMPISSRALYSQDFSNSIVQCVVVCTNIHASMLYTPRSQPSSIQRGSAQISTQTVARCSINLYATCLSWTQVNATLS